MLKLISGKAILIQNSLRLGFARSRQRKQSKQQQFKYKDPKEQAFQAASQQFMKDAFEEYKNHTQKDTVLRDFRRDILRRQQVPDFMKQIDKTHNLQQRKIDRALGDDKNPDKVRRFSKRLMQKFVNNQQVVQNKDLFKDHTDYTVYSQNYTKMGDRRLGHREMFDRSQSIRRGYEFIQKLPEDYEQKIDVKQKIRSQQKRDYENITISQYAKEAQETMETVRLINQFRSDTYDHVQNDQQSNIYEKADVANPYDDYTNMITQNFNPQTSPMMSPQAINKIYELYTQGWNVRDISRRFGILPFRTKFYIWCRAQLYHQVLPKSGIKHFIMNMQRDKELAQEGGGYMDYGLDMQYLGSPFILRGITSWESESVDVQRKPEQYSEALRKLENKKRFTKYQAVQVGTHGKENSMYLLKQWHIFRGKGSNEYHLKNTTFRALSKAKRKMLYQYY